MSTYIIYSCVVCTGSQLSSTFSEVNSARVLVNQIADSLEKLDTLQNEMNETLKDLDREIVICATACSTLSSNYATRFSNYLITVRMYSTPPCYVHTLYTAHLYVTYTIYSTPLCYIHYIQHTSMLHTLYTAHLYATYTTYIQHTSMLHTLYTYMY